MDDYERFEAECDEVRADNEKLLDEFDIWLKNSGLSKNTINTHVRNIDLYINHFLLYEDVIKPEDGACEVSMFLGYWFIKKAMWSSPASIKSNAASLKKFYTFLLDKQLVDKEDLDELKSSIKEGISEWVEKVDRFWSPS